MDTSIAQLYTVAFGSSCWFSKIHILQVTNINSIISAPSQNSHGKSAWSNIDRSYLKKATVEYDFCMTTYSWKANSPDSTTWLLYLLYISREDERLAAKADLLCVLGVDCLGNTFRGKRTDCQGWKLYSTSTHTTYHIGMHGACMYHAWKMHVSGRASDNLYINTYMYKHIGAECPIQPSHRDRSKSTE